MAPGGPSPLRTQAELVVLILSSSLIDLDVMSSINIRMCHELSLPVQTSAKTKITESIPLMAMIRGT